MSYDIMVIDHHPRFKKSKDFLSWYDNVTKWEDEVDYNDYRHATTPLQNWYLEMKDVVPPLNGQFAPANDKLGTGEFPEADYSIAKDAIYVALSYEKVEEVKEIAFNLAKKYKLAYFDISGSNELANPDGTYFDVSSQQAYYEDYSEQCLREFRHRNSITSRVAMVLLVLVMVCFIFRESWGMYVGVPTLVVFILFAIWSNKWIKRTNDDVLETFKQQTAPPKVNSDDDVAPLLADVLWNFRLGQFENQMEFFLALKEYNEKVLGKPFDYPIRDTIECIGAESDFILFEEDTEEAEKYKERTVHFNADNHHAFTGIEILYKLNNELYPLLQDSDSIFFEGIHCYQLMGSKRTTCQVLLGN